MPIPNVVGEAVYEPPRPQAPSQPAWEDFIYDEHGPALPAQGGWRGAGRTMPTGFGRFDAGDPD